MVEGPLVFIDTIFVCGSAGRTGVLSPDDEGLLFAAF